MLLPSVLTSPHHFYLLLPTRTAETHVKQTVAVPLTIAQELMRYFFSTDDIEPDTEDTPTMAAFRALGLDPDREPDALKVFSRHESLKPTTK